MQLFLNGLHQKSTCTALLLWAALIVLLYAVLKHTETFWYPYVFCHNLIAV